MFAHIAIWARSIVAALAPAPTPVLPPAPSPVPTPPAPSPVPTPPCAASSMPKVRQWTIWCPFGQNCTKRGKRLGNFNSDADARAALKNHLENSPYHDDLDKKTIEKAVEDEQTQFWDEDIKEEPASKKPKVDKVRSPSRGPGGSDRRDPPPRRPAEQYQRRQAAAAAAAGDGKKEQQKPDPPMPSLLKEVADKAAKEAVAALLQQQQEQQQQQPQQQSPSTPASLVGSGSALAVATQQLDIAAAAAQVVDPADMLSVPRKHVEAIVDAAMRLEHSARQASRVGTAASQSFSAEADILAASLASLRDIMRKP